jgi:hypothetical protein
MGAAKTLVVIVNILDDDIVSIAQLTPPICRIFPSPYFSPNWSRQITFR